MQRGAASPQASPSPGVSGPPSKRIRLSADGASPGTPNSALREALEAEERQRARVLEKHSEALGETRWVLGAQQTSVKPTSSFAVVTAGFADIDALDGDDSTLERHGDTHDADAHTDDADERRSSGRRVFGNLKRKLSERTSAADTESEAESSDTHPSADEDDPAAQLIRAERKAAAAKVRERLRTERKEKRAELDRLAEGRRKKEVKLNKLTSISGGRGLGSRPGNSTPTKDMQCFRCGKMGHMKAQCPQSRT